MGYSNDQKRWQYFMFYILNITLQEILLCVVKFDG